MRKHNAQEITELGLLLSRLFRNPRRPEADWETLEALVGDLQGVGSPRGSHCRCSIRCGGGGVGPARWELGQARRIVIGLAANHRPAA